LTFFFQNTSPRASRISLGHLESGHNCGLVSVTFGTKSRDNLSRLSYILRGLSDGITLTFYDQNTSPRASCISLGHLESGHHCRIVSVTLGTKSLDNLSRLSFILRALSDGITLTFYNQNTSLRASHISLGHLESGHNCRIVSVILGTKSRDILFRLSFILRELSDSMEMTFYNQTISLRVSRTSLGHLESAHNCRIVSLTFGTKSRHNLSRLSNILHALSDRMDMTFHNQKTSLRASRISLGHLESA